MSEEDSGSSSEDCQSRGCRCGLRSMSPRLYRWLQARAGTPTKVALVIVFSCADMIRYQLQEEVWNKTSNVNILSVIMVINLCSLVISLSTTFALEGAWAIDKIFDIHAVWRWIVIAAMFQFAYHLVALAMDTGVGAINVVMMGYLYMPLSALFSYLLFRRDYGQLEWVALIMMMLATMAVVFLRERCRMGDCFTGSSSLDGFFRLLLAVVLSAGASCLAERIFKDRSVGLFRAHEEHRHDHYYIHKVHLDFGGSLVALSVWLVPAQVFRISMLGLPGDDLNSKYFGDWTQRTWLFVAANVCQWWMAGLIAKRFSTVVKALIQTCSTVVLIFVADEVFEKVGGMSTRVVPTVMLVIVVLLSALVFQTGRIDLTEIRRLTASRSQNKMHALNVSTIFEGFVSMLQTKDPDKDNDDDPGDSLMVMARKYVIIILYILADATRIELYTLTVGSTQITPQSFSVAINSGMLLLSNVLILTGRPQEGSTSWADLKEAWRPAKLLIFMPSGLFFAITSALMSMAFGLGLSGAMSVVIGKIYLPVCALASRFLLGKFYLWLEWFAIIILTLDSAAFGALQTMSSSSTTGPTPILLCAGSATSAAIAALVMEKLMKSEPGKPFMMQKLRSDFACWCWSVLFLWPMGWMANPEYFAKGAYWLYRPLTLECSRWGMIHLDAMGICGSWVNGTVGGIFNADGSSGTFVFGAFGNNGFSVNATLSDDSCACGNGIWVAFNDYRILVMLVVAIFYGFITGLVVTKFGSVKRAIADAFSLMLVYFVGDPLIKGSSLADTALNLTCCILPLSSQCFSIAAEELRRVDQARRKADDRLQEKDAQSTETDADSSGSDD